MEFKKVVTPNLKVVPRLQTLGEAAYPRSPFSLALAKAVEICRPRFCSSTIRQQKF